MLDVFTGRAETEPELKLTYVHRSEDGELQQGGGEAVSEGEDERRLLSEQLLHGVLQPQVQTPVTLHKVRQAAARLQKLLHLRGEESSRIHAEVLTSADQHPYNWSNRAILNLFKDRFI